jgi:hypothetical protein
MTLEYLLKKMQIVYMLTFLYVSLSLCHLYQSVCHLYNSFFSIYLYMFLSLEIGDGLLGTKRPLWVYSIAPWWYSCWIFYLWHFKTLLVYSDFKWSKCYYILSRMYLDFLLIEWSNAYNNHDMCVMMYYSVSDKNIRYQCYPCPTSSIFDTHLSIFASVFVFESEEKYENISGFDDISSYSIRLHPYVQSRSLCIWK